MKTQLASYQTVHLTDGAKVRWGEPRPLKDDPTWTVELEVDSWLNGIHVVTYFGTEAQMKAIAKGCDGFLEEPITPDPAQLDALEVAETALLSGRLDMVDLATRAVGLGGVKSW